MLIHQSFYQENQDAISLLQNLYKMFCFLQILQSYQPMLGTLNQMHNVCMSPLHIFSKVYLKVLVKQYLPV